VATLPVDDAARALATGTYDLGQMNLVVRDNGRGGLEGVLGTQAATELLYQGNNEFRPANNPDFLIRFRTSQGATTVAIDAAGSTLQGKKQ
jgi:hypothetical protein